MNKRQAENCPADMSGLGPNMSGLDRIYLKKGGIYPVHPKNFFSTLILELRGTKLNATWTQVSPQHKE
jgi:hypothetical protein